MVRKKTVLSIAQNLQILALLLLVGILPATYVEAESSPSEAAITFVGVDNDNAPIEVILPSRKYQENLKTAVAAINDSTLEALNTQVSRKAWSLKVVLVGVGANLELGVGSLIKVAVLPRFRLLFSNTNDPAVP